MPRAWSDSRRRFLTLEALESRLAPAGDFGNLITFGAKDDDQYGRLATDASGNVYALGQFRNETIQLNHQLSPITIDLDAGPRVAEVTANSSDVYFLTKFSPDGAVLWVREIGDYFITPERLAVDTAGNVYLAGRFFYTADFDPGPGTYNLTSEGYGSDLFVSKFTPVGDFVWAKAIAIPNSLYWPDVNFAVTGSGEVYLAGQFDGTVDFDPGPGVANLTNQPYGSSINHDWFVLKLNNAGNFTWVKRIGGPAGAVFVHGVGVDAAGNFYACGTFEGTVDFGPYSITSTHTDGFVWKVSTAGIGVWSYVVDLTISDGDMTDLAVDPAGNVYVVGNFHFSASFPGLTSSPLPSMAWYDSFALKLDTTGSAVWLYRFPRGNYIRWNDGIALGPSGDVYLDGIFEATIDFDSGPGVASLTPSGSNLFLLRLDPAGQFSWVRATYGGDSVTGGIAVDGAGNVYASGSFTGTTDFDPGPGEHLLSSQSYPFQLSQIDTPDAFLLKLTPVALPAVSIADESIVEGSGGTKKLTFTVSLAAASALPVTVRYDTANFTAAAPGDFVATSGSVTFAPGVTSQKVEIPIITDGDNETDETFIVSLRAPVNARIGRLDAVGTILNDDFRSLSIHDARMLEGTSAGKMYIYVSLSGPTAQEVSVHYTTADVTAKAGSDYTLTTGTFTIPAGQSSSFVEVPILGDVAVEATETFRVTLDTPVNVILGRAVATGTILNDDFANIPPGISETSSLAGRAAGTLQYSPSGQLAQVRWQDDALVYRVRQPNGSWTQEAVGPTGGGKSDTFVPSRSAVLLFSADGTPHVLTHNNNNEIEHYVRTAGGWASVAVENQSFPDLGFLQRIGTVTAAMGTGGALHVLVTGLDFGGVDESVVVPLYYGTNKDGSWKWEYVRGIGVPFTWAQGGTTPRTLSLAVDAQNFAHVSFSPRFVAQEVRPGGPSRLYSELWYGTNRSGTWAYRKVYGPADNSGDAGLASSIAINPATNRPQIAAYYVERVPTGSPSSSRLMFHTQLPNGSWASGTIPATNGGFRAGNRFTGTGFAPDLKFDARGVPHITLLDEAEILLPGGKSAVSGQLRYAHVVKGRWVVETISRMTNALAEEMHLPVIAVSRTEVSFFTLRRRFVVVEGHYVLFDYFVDASRKLV